MDTQIAPPPTLTERLQVLADRMREAMSRSAIHKTNAAWDESARAQRAFFKTLEEALATVAPPAAAPAQPRPPLPAFIALPNDVRTRAAEAAERGLRGVIGEGSKTQHQTIAAAVWNFMRTYAQEGTNA